MIKNIDLVLVNADNSTVLLPEYSGLNFDVQAEFAHSTINFVYPLSLAKMHGLKAGSVIALDIESTRLRTWFVVENVSGTFITDDGLAQNYSGHSLSVVLDDDFVWPSAWPNPRPQGHAFVDANPGTQVKTFLTRSQQRGYLTKVTHSTFTGTLDSAGQSWTLGKVLDKNWPSGHPLSQVIRDLITMGMCDARMNGWAVEMYLPDTMARTIDYTFRPGRDVRENNLSKDSQAVATDVLVEGEEGSATTATNTAAYGLLGRRRARYVAHGGISDPGTLSLLAAEELAQAGHVAEEHTWQIEPVEGAPMPFTGYDVDDWLYFDYGDGNDPQKLQVKQLSCSQDESGFTVTMTVGDIIMDADERRQRKIDAIAGSNSAGTYSPIPGTTVQDRLAPAAAPAPMANSGAYVDENGTTMAQVTLTSGQVTTNVDGTPATDVATYEFFIRPASETSWTLAGRVDEGGNRAVFVSALPVNTPYQAQTFVYDAGGLKSAPSPIRNFTTGKDTIAPGVPTGVSAAATYGGTLFTWGGYLQSPIPADFDVILIHESETSGFTPTAATLKASAKTSATVFINSTPTPKYYAAQARDNSGNLSAPIHIPNSVTPLGYDALTETIQDQVDELSTTLPAQIVDVETRLGTEIDAAALEASQALADAAAAHGLASTASASATDANNAAVLASAQAMAAALAGPSLTANGDFELGTTAWTDGLTPPKTDVVTLPATSTRSGTKVLRFKDLTANASPRNTAYSQVSPGRTYLLEYWAKRPAGAGTATQIGFLVNYQKTDGSNASPTIPVLASNALSSGGWTKISATYTMPEDATAARFAPWVPSGAVPAGHTVDVDDFYVWDITEAEKARLRAEEAASAAAAAVNASTEAKEAADAAVTGSVTEYALSASESTAPTSGWSTTSPTRTAGTFIWMRTTITYGSGDTSTTNPVLVTGNTGAPGSPGSPGAAAKTISLTATTQVLVSPASGGATNPATSVVTGTAVNTTISVWQYAVNGGAWSGTAPAGVSRSGNTVTITGATMTAKTITVRMADAGGIADTLTVAKATDGAAGTPGDPGAPGADAYTVLLSNEAHVFPGTVSAAVAGAATTTVTTYKGASQVSSSVGTVTGAPTGMSVAVTGNGTNAPTVTVSVTSALTQASGKLIVPVTVDGKLFTKEFAWSVAYSGQDGAPGNPGAPAAVISLTATTQVLVSPSGGGATSPTTAVVTGTAANTTISVWQYSVDGAAFTTTAPAGVSRTNNVVTITGSTMTARTITVRMADANNVADTLTVAKTFDGAAGTPGSPGAPGKGITGSATTYQASASGTTTPTGTWTTTIPTVTPGQYLWTRTITTYTDASTSTAYSVAGHGTPGDDGDPGNDGVGISNTTVTYQVGTSGTTAPTGTWSSTVLATSPGQYLWTRTVVTYTDATSSTSYSVAAHGTTGAPGTDGIGITSTVVTYQAGTSGTSAPTGTWTSTVPAVTPGQYLWTRTVISYTSGSPTTSYSVAAHGTPGDDGDPGNDGVGVSGTVITYQVGTSATSAPTGTWSSTVVSTSPGQYLWTRTVTTYTDNSTSTGYSVAAHGSTGSPGNPGADAYTVLLTNEAMTFPGSTTAALGGSETAGIIAYKGGTQMPATIGTITGQVSGLTTSVAGSGTTAPVITVTVTTSLTTRSGKLVVPVTVDGKSFTKEISWSVSYAGSPGTPGSPGSPGGTISLTTTSQVMSVSATGTLSPTSVTVTGTAVNTTIASWQYSTNGAAWTSTVPAGVSRTNNVVTITGSTMTAKTLGVRMADSSGNISDSVTVAKVSDGQTGTPGTPGTPGADAYTVLLSNEAMTFPGSTTAALAGSETSKVIAYKGTVAQNISVGTITGQVTGLTTAVASSGTTAPVITVTVTTALTTRSGKLVVPLTVDGKSFSKEISWSLSLAGTPGTPGSPGAPGDPGTPGVSVTAIVPHFYRQPSLNAAPAQPTVKTPSGWVTTEPDYLAGNSLYRSDRVDYSNGSFSWTAVTKVSSWEIAATALTSANGRNSRITSTSAASGTTNPTTGLALVNGDTWWQWDSTSARNVIGAWTWNGSAWVREMINHEVIASMDVNKLVVSGSARMAQAVVDKIVGDAAFFNLLTAERLTIQPGNSFPDPFFRAPGTTWSGTGTLAVDASDMPGGRALQITSSTAQVGAYYGSSNALTVQLEPGGQYRVRAVVKITGTGAQALNFYLRYVNTAGTFTSTSVNLVPGSAAAGVATFTATITAPATSTTSSNQALYNVGFFTTSPYVAGVTFHVSSMELIRIANGTLIEDGAVWANHMGSNSVTTNALAAGAVTGEKILSRSIFTNHLAVGGNWNEVPNGYGEWGVTGGWADANSSANLSFQTTSLPANSGVTGYLRGNAAQGTYVTPNVYWDTSPGEEFLVEIWLKASVANSRIYVEIKDQNNAHGATYKAVPGGGTNGSGSGLTYPIENVAVPTVWTKYECIATAKTTSTRLTMGSILFNHSNSTTKALQDIAVRVRRRNGAVLIEDGAVTATKLEGELVLGTRIIAGSPTGAAAEMSPNGFEVWTLGSSGRNPVPLTRLGVPGTADVLTITDGFETQASITSDGTISGNALAIGDDPNFNGQLLMGAWANRDSDFSGERDSILWQLPWGTVGSIVDVATIAVAGGYNSVGPGVTQMLAYGTWDLLSGREYDVRLVDAEVSTSGATSNYYSYTRLLGTSAALGTTPAVPTSTSSEFAQHRHYGAPLATMYALNLSTGVLLRPSSDKTYNIAVALSSANGTTTIRDTGAGIGWRLMVSDLGPTTPLSGAGYQSSAPPPLKKYTYYFNAADPIYQYQGTVNTTNNSYTWTYNGVRQTKKAVQGRAGWSSSAYHSMLLFGGQTSISGSSATGVSLASALSGAQQIVTKLRITNAYADRTSVRAKVGWTNSNTATPSPQVDSAAISPGGTTTLTMPAAFNTYIAGRGSDLRISIGPGSSASNIDGATFYGTDGTASQKMRLQVDVWKQ